MSKKRIVYVIVTFAIFTAISVSLFPVSRAEAETSLMARGVYRAAAEGK